MRARIAFAVLAFLCLAMPARAQDHNFPTPGGSIVNGDVVMCLNGSGQAVPCSSGTPLQVSIGGSGGGIVQTKSGTYASSGAGQMALAVSTNTTLTVPANTTCAQITVETANIRRTSDGTSATTTNGTLIAAGSSWQDCGPLATYQFTAVSGSPTLDVEYFK